MEKYFYFGCGTGPGHHLFDETRKWVVSNALTSIMERMDGELAPAFNNRAPYQAAFSRLGAIGYSAISWWDYSVDTRPGSNSIIFAPGTFSSKYDMLLHAKKLFPWVFDRLPQELTWWLK